MERHCSAVGLYLRGAANELPACQELEEQEGTAAPQCRAPRAAAVRARGSERPHGILRESCVETEPLEKQSPEEPGCLRLFL